MIVDRLEHCSKYRPLGNRLARALDYLLQTDFSVLSPGEQSVDGGNIFAIVSDYNLKPLSAGRLEAHKRYIDIQYLVSGAEEIGYCALGAQQPTMEYDAESDLVFYGGSTSLLRLEEGMFAIFSPQDLHMPGIGAPEERVRKVVIKVLI